MAAVGDVPLTPIIDTVTGSVTEIGRIFLRTLAGAVNGLAPIDATYWTSRAEGILSAEVNLGALAPGYLKIATAIGVATPSTVPTIPVGDVTGLAAALADKASLSQSNTFAGTPQFFSTANPTSVYTDTSAPANARVFYLANSGQLFVFRAATDAFAVVAQPLTLTRAGDVQIGRDCYEKGRTTPIGHWIDVPYAAGNFTAAGAMVWTVDAADQVTFAYTLIGKTLLAVAYLNGTSISGTPSNTLFVPLPGGLTASKVVQSSITAFDNGAFTLATTRIGVSGATPFQQIEITRADGANWAPSVNNTYIRLDMRIPIQ